MSEPFTFTLPVLTANVPNKNKRIYPEHLLQQETARLSEVVKSRGLFGMIGYPENTAIQLDRVSHVITELYLDTDQPDIDRSGTVTLWAKAEVLNTQQGRVLQEMIDKNGLESIALRPMGIGSVKTDENGIATLDDSYKMTTISVVPAEDAA